MMTRTTAIPLVKSQAGMPARRDRRRMIGLNVSEMKNAKITGTRKSLPRVVVAVMAKISKPQADFLCGGHRRAAAPQPGGPKGGATITASLVARAAAPGKSAETNGA